MKKIRQKELQDRRNKRNYQGNLKLPTLDKNLIDIPILNKSQIVNSK